MTSLRNAIRGVALATVDPGTPDDPSPDAALLVACEVWADALEHAGDPRAVWVRRGIALARSEGGAVEYRAGYSSPEAWSVVSFISTQAKTGDPLDVDAPGVCVDLARSTADGDFYDTLTVGLIETVPSLEDKA